MKKKYFIAMLMMIVLFCSSCATLQKDIVQLQNPDVQPQKSYPEKLRRAVVPASVIYID